MKLSEQEMAAENGFQSEEKRGFTIVLEEFPRKTESLYQDTALPLTGGRTEMEDPGVPEKIREMIRLYEYGDGSMTQKCRNFYRQGKFMEDYEDDHVWIGSLRRYFTTYHDLNIPQLRGYFTWRAAVRKGTYGPIAESLAYLYLYELLNGIGADLPEDSLRKMKEFEAGFLDSGIGDPGMRKNLRRWMLEFAVLEGMDAETVRQYADPALLEKDRDLMALKNPSEHSEEEVFHALLALAGKKLSSSPVLSKGDNKGRHLFAAFWSYLTEHYDSDTKDFFIACFGEPKTYIWYPLSNAVYRKREESADRELVLNASRSYRCRGGVWEQTCYDPLYFDRVRFQTLIHAADRLFRKYLKTGHYLSELPKESWAVPYVEAFLAEERKKEEEALRPVITINLEGLQKIRQDASITRESLLTEEERLGKEPLFREEQEDIPERKDPELLYIQILTALINGQSADKLLKDNHLMPSVAADGINEMLFDEIGDSVLLCEDDKITLVKDYREDVIRFLGEKDS